MIDFASSPLPALMDEKGCPCGCGRVHFASLKILHIGSGVIAKTEEVLSKLGSSKPFLVCDVNTFKAAGEQVVARLQAASIEHTLFVFPEREARMEPDEWAVGALLMAFDPSCDAIVAIGTGVIGDCCKVLSHAVGKPMLTIGTAPSMDGYASGSSSMIQNHVKVTLYNKCPEAIICDTDILRNAPMHMLHAGLGDMLAKCISLCEWKISHMVIGEYYCENIARLVKRSLDRVLDAADGLVRRDAEAVEAVCEGLVLSGVSMNFAGISRPASGLEHYFSHLWEMFALTRGEFCDLHGIQVGVGSYLTIGILKALCERVPDRAHAEAMMRAFDKDTWERNMRDIFGPIADTIIDSEYNLYKKNDPGKHAKRLDRILSCWPEIVRTLREDLPSLESIRDMMQRLSMPMLPSDIDISQQDTRRALIGSREIRDKYLSSSLLWDLGWLDEFAQCL